VIADKVESVSEYATACIDMLTDEIVISAGVHPVRVGTGVPGRGWSRRQEAMTLSQPPWLTDAPWLGVMPGLAWYRSPAG
jgi:hypothetical protein